MNQEALPNEAIRQLIDMAVRSGREKQSRQTGYLHFCYQIPEEDKHDPIPVVENMLFALALLRTRTAENILEAKTILDNLLHFQLIDGPSSGNFPKYLHEFPSCKQRLIGANLLPPLYWILKSFHQILGSELRQRLESALKNLINFCIKTYREKPAPYQVALKIAAAAKSAGRHLNIPTMEIEGDSLLTELHAVKTPEAWYSPADIAEILIALQMVYPCISRSPWSEFWGHLEKTWHHSTCSYIGPSIREYQQGFEPQPTLYDLYLGYFSKTFSKRTSGNQIYHLQACLIQPSEDKLEKPHLPLINIGSLNDHAYFLKQDEKCAFSIFERKEAIDPSEKGFHPFRLIWGQCDRTHSFVCQGGTSKQMTFNTHEDGVDLIFYFEEPLGTDEKEKSREIAFYFDMHEEINITTKGSSSNTFLLGDEVKIVSKGLSLAMHFILEEGDGRFFGHLMPGNRPAQTSAKGHNQFQAYDWQLFLRTLHRPGPCQIRVSIKALFEQEFPLKYI